MSEFEVSLSLIVLFSLFANTAIALYGVFSKPNLVKKLISMTILSDTANAFAIVIGYRAWHTPQESPVPPVLTNISGGYAAVQELAQRSVDPLPQALVLTAVVIGLAVTIFLASIILHYHRTHGTVEMVVSG